MPDTETGLSRRQLLERGALLGLASAIAPLPGAAGITGGSGTALAQSTDLTVDTFNGLLAFLVPGDDPYSRHQGQSTRRPGGVGANVARTLVGDLDHFVPASVFGSQGITVPASAGVANLLNSYAARVNPAAAGPFLSPFSRLSSSEKADVFRRMESDLEPSDSELAFVAGILPGFATFLSFSEAGVLDRSDRKLSRRPLGWELTDFAGRSHGWPELRGYYQGRRKVAGAGKHATEVPH